MIKKQIGIKVMTFFHGETRKLCKSNIHAYIPTGFDYRNYPKNKQGWIEYCPITSDETEAKRIAVHWRLRYEQQKVKDANFYISPLGIPFDAPPTRGGQEGTY